MSKPCDGSIETTLCYPVTQYVFIPAVRFRFSSSSQKLSRHITKYLSLPKVRTELGVDPSVPANFSSCSDKVGLAFGLSQDVLQSSTEHVAALLERGVRVLIYVVRLPSLLLPSVVDLTYIFNLWTNREHMTGSATTLVMRGGHLRWNGQGTMNSHLSHWGIGWLMVKSRVRRGVLKISRMLPLTVRDIWCVYLTCLLPFRVSTWTSLHGLMMFIHRCRTINPRNHWRWFSVGLQGKIFDPDNLPLFPFYQM